MVHCWIYIYLPWFESSHGKNEISHIKYSVVLFHGTIFQPMIEIIVAVFLHEFAPTKKFQPGYTWSLYMWAVIFKASSIASPLVLKLNTHIPPLLISRERNLNIKINVKIPAPSPSLGKTSKGCFSHATHAIGHFRQAIQIQIL